MSASPALSIIDLAVISLYSAADAARQSQERLALPSVSALEQAAITAVASLDQAVESLRKGQQLADIESALIAANAAARALQQIVVASKSTQTDRVVALDGIKSATRAAGLLEALR